MLEIIDDLRDAWIRGYSVSELWASLSQLRVDDPAKISRI